MKNLNSFITEVKGEKAHRDAVAMGLKYKGFGYWVDPNTGKVTHKTENDQLVPVDPDVESELADKDDETAGMARSGGAGAPGGMAIGGAATAAAVGMPDSDAILGTADPGEGAQRPKEMEWNAGPDGDNCVDDQAPGEVAPDSYVGKTNHPNWQAGPDGSNFTNVEEAYGSTEFEKKLQRNFKADKKIRDMDAGVERSDPNTVTQGKIDRMKGLQIGAPKEPTKKKQPAWMRVTPKEDQTEVKPGAGTMVRQAMGLTDVKPGQKFSRTMRDARAAADEMKGDKDKQTILGKQIASMMKLKNREKRYDDQETFDDNVDKQADMWRKMAGLPAVAKDAEVVKQMNEVAKGLVKDPDYDLTQDADEDSEDWLDSGVFGSVFDKNDGNVIKKGYLGPNELEALYAMRDNPAFPDLINAKFDSPFKQISSQYNNPLGDSGQKRKEGEDQYWNPSDNTDFDRRFPGAEGTYAMSMAKGSPLFNAVEMMDDETKEKVIRNFWNARRDLHQAGISHNDMHGGNIFADPDTGEVNIIDLGLANTDPLSALMEGLGGADFEEGDDYQVSHHVSGSNTPQDIMDKFLDNRKSIQERLEDTLDLPNEYDDYDEDQDYSPTYNGSFDTIFDMMRGGIRKGKSDLQNIRDQVPFLQDDDNVKDLIKLLYKGVGQSDLEDRMSKAFDKRQADSKVIRMADRIRALNNEPPIEVKNKAVVPPKNLDFDD